MEATGIGTFRSNGRFAELGKAFRWHPVEVMHVTFTNKNRRVYQNQGWFVGGTAVCPCHVGKCHSLRPRTRSIGVKSRTKNTSQIYPAALNPNPGLQGKGPRRVLQ